MPLTSTNLLARTIAVIRRACLLAAGGLPPSFLLILLIPSPLEAQTGLPPCVGSYLRCAMHNHRYAMYSHYRVPIQTYSRYDIREPRYRKQMLDYRKQALEFYYYKRTLHKAHNTHDHPTREDIIRYSKMSIPDRLAPGEIHWPGILLGDEFTDRRMWLECLFTEREVPGGNGTICYEVQKTAEEMRRELQARIREVHPADYIKARKFLKSVAYEAQFLSK